MEDKDRLQICWQAFSMENSLLQSYRMLFMMVEAALLALGFVLLEGLKDASISVPFIGWKVAIIWIPAGIGWGIVAIWVVICEAKGKDVDRWMKRIVGFQSIIEKDWSMVGKDWSMVGKDWFNYLKPGVKFPGGRIARILFNYIIPLLVAVLWLIIVREFSGG